MIAIRLRSTVYLRVFTRCSNLRTRVVGLSNELLCQVFSTPAGSCPPKTIFGSELFNPPCALPRTLLSRFPYECLQGHHLHHRNHAPMPPWPLSPSAQVRCEVQDGTASRIHPFATPLASKGRRSISVDHTSCACQPYYLSIAVVMSFNNSLCSPTVYTWACVTLLSWERDWEVLIGGQLYHQSLHY